MIYTLGEPRPSRDLTDPNMTPDQRAQLCARASAWCEGPDDLNPFLADCLHVNNRPPGVLSRISTGAEPETPCARAIRFYAAWANHAAANPAPLIEGAPVVVSDPTRTTTHYRAWRWGMPTEQVTRAPDILRAQTIKSKTVWRAPPPAGAEKPTKTNTRLYVGAGAVALLLVWLAVKK